MARPPPRDSPSRVDVSSADVWSAVAAERQGLVDDLSDVTLEQWATPSLCPGWSVHDVIAHLVDGAQLTRFQFTRRLLRAGGDSDRMAAEGVRRWREADPRVTLAALAEVAGLTVGPPLPLSTRLVEIYVHSEDVRRPLGRPRAHPTASVLAALDHQTRTTVVFGGGKEIAEGLTLTPSDTLVSIGSGPRVVGRTIDLLMAISGRVVAPAAFSGAGLDEFTARLER